jgi:hypothetical protein
VEHVDGRHLDRVRGRRLAQDLIGLIPRPSSSSPAAATAWIETP